MLENILHLRPVMGQYISYSAPFYALLTALFLLFFFRMMGLLKREGRFRQRIVNLYYLYLPLILVLCASAWMYAVGAERYVLTTMEEVRPELMRISSESMEKTWKHREDAGSNDRALTPYDTGDSMASAYLSAFIEGGEELLKKHALHEVVLMAEGGAHDRMMWHINNELVFIAEESEEIPLSTLEARWREGFDKQIDEGAAVDFLLDEIRYRFISFFKKIQLFFLFFSVPVIIEIGYALYQRPPLEEQ